MRECKVHKVHYYKPEVRAIHCMAYEASTKQLALSRSDGSVEVWAVAGAPYVERIMFAGSVESLAWSKAGKESKARLFSAGLHGSVVEFNLLEFNIKHEMPMVGGPVWCIAVDKDNTMLAAGTEEGYVNLLEFTGGDEDPPRALRLLDKQEGRVLCIAWHPDGTKIATGSTDSLRLWDVATGRGTHRMTVGRDALLAETTVWCVAVTQDGLAVAGDSRGVLSFWDLASGTQAQALVTHAGPVLALALAFDDQSVYCTGVDPVVACVSRAGSERWVRGVDRRLHEHDVRALACAGRRLFSAGVDGHLAVSRYPPKVLNKYPPIPHDAVCLSQSRRLLLRHLQHIELWSLGSAADKTGKRLPGSEAGSQQLLCLRSKHNEHIVCAAVSADGEFIAYATPTTTRLVQVSYADDACSVVKSSSACAGGALALAFCPTSPRLALASRGGAVSVLALAAGAERHALIAQIERLHLTDAVRLLSFSPCSAHLAVSDLGGNVVVFSTDDWSRLASMPTRPVNAVALVHRPDMLAAVYADHTIAELCVSEGGVTTWSSENVDPRHWWSRPSVVSRAAWDPRRPDFLMLADDSALFGLRPIGAVGRPTKLKKPRATDAGAALDFGKAAKTEEIATLKKYKHLAFAGWLGDDELVVVETTPAALEAGLPPALRKPLFGTK